MKGLFTSMVSFAANTCLASDSTSYQTLLICFTQKNLEDKKMMKGKIKSRAGFFTSSKNATKPTYLIYENYLLR